MKKWLTILVLFLIGCVDPVSLDLPTSEPKLVVFGWVTNEIKPYEVSLSLTNNFSDISDYTSVTGAEVYVLDNLDQRHDFIEQDDTGKYYSDPNDFIGVIGNAYTLHVITAKQEHYVTLSEPLLGVPPLASASISFLNDPDIFEIADDEDNYFATGFVQDEVELSNFYRWKIYVDGKLKNRPTEITLFDDNFSNGNTFRFDASNVLFKKNQLVQIEHYSLTIAAYEFYSSIKRQTENDQLEPRPIPAIIKGNVYNLNDSNELVLGYFGASEVIIYDLQW